MTNEVFAHHLLHIVPHFGILVLILLVYLF
jgi:hypothetical protein